MKKQDDQRTVGVSEDTHALLAEYKEKTGIPIRRTIEFAVAEYLQLKQQSDYTIEQPKNTGDTQ